MFTGNLRVKVKVYRSVQTGVGDYNVPIVEEQLWRETFAEMRSRRGNEHVVGAQIFSLTQWYFVFRYHSVDGIDPAMWLVVNGQKYDIRNIVPDFARKRQIEVEARVANINMVDGSSGGVFALSINLESNMPDGEVGVAYTGATPDVTGGTAPYSFSTTGTLPAGLAVNSSTGIITGSPTGAGTSSFSIVVTDANGDTATLPLSITIEAP